MCRPPNPSPPAALFDQIADTHRPVDPAAKLDKGILQGPKINRRLFRGNQTGNRPPPPGDDERPTGFGAPKQLRESILRFECSNLDDVLVDGTIHLKENHTVAGNPARFSGGAVRIRPDVEWEQRLGAAPRRIITALTLPWLRRYRYPIRVPASPPREPG